MMRLRPYFPLGRGRTRVDDKRVLSGIILFDRMGRGGVSLPRKTIRTRLYTITRDRGGMCGYSRGPWRGRCQSTGKQDDLHRRKSPQGSPHGLQPEGKTEGPGRLIGRTKGCMNTQLHAVTDTIGHQSGSLCPLARSGGTPERELL